MINIKVIANLIDGLPVPEDSFIEVILDNEFIIINHIEFKIFKKNVVNTFKIKRECVIDVIIKKRKNINKKKKALFIISYMSNDDKFKKVKFKLPYNLSTNAAEKFVRKINKENLNKNSLELRNLDIDL